MNRGIAEKNGSGTGSDGLGACVCVDEDLSKFEFPGQDKAGVGHRFYGLPKLVWDGREEDAEMASVTGGVLLVFADVILNRE